MKGWQGVTTRKEFKLTLLKFWFVSQKLKPYGKDMKKTCACKLCGEIGHNHKEHKDECPHCEGSHPAEECPTRQITCSYVKGLPTTRSVSHLPHGTKNHPAEERSNERSPHGNF